MIKMILSKASAISIIIIVGTKQKDSLPVQIPGEPACQATISSNFNGDYHEEQ